MVHDKGGASRHPMVASLSYSWTWEKVLMWRPSVKDFRRGELIIPDIRQISRNLYLLWKRRDHKAYLKGLLSCTISGTLNFVGKGRERVFPG